MIQSGLNSTIGDVTTVVTKGTTPTTMGRSFTSSGIGFIKAECISDDGALIKEKQVFIDEETDHLLKRSRLQRDDVLFSIAGVIGRTALVQEAILPANTNQAIAILRPKGEVIDPRFLYYTVRAKGFQDHSLGHVVQTAQANVSLGVLSAAPIWLPSFPVQRRIAGILSAYDDLMENSQRRIRLLEAMARALYREWFVHFRFPGHEKHPRVASPLGDIPKGWEVKALSALCSRMESGGTPKRKSSEYWANGSIDWFKTGELWDGFLFGSEEKITERGQRESNARIFDPGTILMAIYGSPTVGRLGIVTRPSSCNQAALGLVADKNQISQTFLYFVLISLREHFNGIAQGAAQQNISKEKVANAVAVVPPRELVAAFDRLAEPTFSQIQTLQSQIQNLRRTRDLLLPRLLSGQLEIGNN